MASYVSKGAICGIISTAMLIGFWVAMNVGHSVISDPYIVFVAIPVVMLLCLVLAVFASWKSSRWWMVTVIGILITGLGYLSIGE
jgi:hypothetical protein